MAQLATKVGEAEVVRKFGLGGTGITFQALEKNEIDLYPEYTGTISEAILKEPSLKDWKTIKEHIEDENFQISLSLGFNNTYALAMKKEKLAKLGLSKLSQLKKFNSLASAFSHEFVQRKDGLKNLSLHYGFKLSNVKTMEHSLAYQALSEGKVDLVEVYSTDAKIEKFDLVLLKDDLNYFPSYLAVIFSQRDFVDKYPLTYQSFERNLIGKIDNKMMTKLNALVELEGYSFAQAAKYFLEGKENTSRVALWDWQKIILRTKEHMALVFISLVLAIIIGIPLGIISAQNKYLGHFLLGANALVQTIPSLALLCLLIPFFGIGPKPATFALFLYALLPIVRGTFTGLKSIDLKLKESAILMGLTKMQRLRFVLLPLASPSIMSGIKTSAIINVGTATLAAFIGAGGLGQIIITGLALNDQQMILQGAIPAGILAIAVHIFFELIDKWIVPVALRRN